MSLSSSASGSTTLTRKKVSAVFSRAVHMHVVSTPAQDLGQTESTKPTNSSQVGPILGTALPKC